MTDAEWEKREHDIAAAWARCADEADSLKDVWEALFATLDERGLPFDTAAFRAACDTARRLIANARVSGAKRTDDSIVGNLNGGE